MFSSKGLQNNINIFCFVTHKKCYICESYNRVVNDW